MKNRCPWCAVLIWLAVFSMPTSGLPVQRAVRIAVLDFELNDLTLLPGRPNEIARTASLAPMLQETLMRKGTYQIVAIPLSAQTKANVAFGYLYDHPDEAAVLAREFDADWIIIGRLHKASDLFAYLFVHVVDANTGRLFAEFYTEIKGPIGNETLTQRGVTRLADQIHDAVSVQKRESTAAPSP
jgi:hypothetical protein